MLYNGQNVRVEEHIDPSKVLLITVEPSVAGVKYSVDLTSLFDTCAAARDLAAKRIGFGEFKRIVRENS